MPYVARDPRSIARINSGVGSYIQDSCGGNQPETDLNYSVAPVNTLALAPLPSDPLQRGEWGSSLNGLGSPRIVPFQAGIGDCGCGCSGGSLGSLTDDLTALVSNPWGLAGLAVAGLGAWWLLRGKSHKRPRNQVSQARQQYRKAVQQSLAAL